MKLRRLLLTLCVALLGILSAPASVIFFTNEALFDAAAPGLAVQTFASANVAPNTNAAFPGPLNSATNNGVFDPGDILPGISFSNTTSPDDLIVYGGPGRFTNNALSAAPGFSAELEVAFASGQTAVALGLLDPLAPNILQRVTVAYFSPTGVLLGTEYSFGGQLPTVPTSGIGIFFGAIATDGDSIGRIRLTANHASVAGGQSFGAAAVDRVEFGNALASVPEGSSTLALLVIALAACWLFAQGWLVRARRCV